MALTAFQRDICRLLAQRRIDAGESYVAGASALNELIGATRVSRDLDLFHDTDEALRAAWAADRRTLESRGLTVDPIRERPLFVEAEVSDGAQRMRLEWARDSAYRFFPLRTHPDLGLTLHPFDLATNKVLALVGRLEVRDWIDVIACDERVQPLGYLAWAASAKDPGFGPAAILEGAARSAHYSADEVAELEFEGPAPDAAVLGQTWHAILGAAGAIVDRLPPDTAGSCVLDADGRLFRGDSEALAAALAAGRVRYQRGRIGGALPVPIDG